MNTSNNPFNVKLEEVIIAKFNGTDRMNITPQVTEFTLYQSIFSALIKADIVLTDGIGLMNNYPLSGEEVVKVTIIQEGEKTQGSGEKQFRKTLEFVVTAIKDIIISDDARQTAYVMELASVEAFINAKTRVSHAYNEDIEGMIKDVYEKYVVKQKPNPKELKIIPVTKKIRKLVIPMLKPFDAIAWLCKFAISDDPEKYYTHIFYETIDTDKPSKFMFKALQKPTFRDAEDDLAFELARRERYFYISNLEIIRSNQAAYQALLAKGFADSRTVNDIKINKRYSALEKTVGGYFENELVELNALKNDYKITRRELKYKDYEFNTLKPGSGFNTVEYIEDVKNEWVETETAPRVRYLVNNFDDANQPSFRDKFGRSSQSFLAFNQVDLSLAVHVNMMMRPGDLFYLSVPEFHGFNLNKEDEYLSGFFIVSEIKTVFIQGGRSQSYLRINKDTFDKNLALKHNYSFDAPAPSSNTMGPR